MFLPIPRMENVDRTALGICGYSALLARHPHLSGVFHDPFAFLLFKAMAVDGERLLSDFPDWASIEAGTEEPANTRLISHIAWRKRWFQDKVLFHLRSGIRQVVFLGAGLDTLSLRLGSLFPDAVFYEVDQTGFIQTKRRFLLEEFGVLPLLRFIPVDFSVETPERPLVAAGYDPGVPTIFVAEVSLEYVAKDDVIETWRMIRRNQSVAPVFLTTFLLNQGGQFSEGIQNTMRQTAQIGDPLQFLPSTEEIHALCKAEGFEIKDWMSGSEVLDYLNGFGVKESDLLFDSELQRQSSLTFAELHFSELSDVSANRTV